MSEQLEEKTTARQRGVLVFLLVSLLASFAFIVVTFSTTYWADRHTSRVMLGKLVTFSTVWGAGSILWAAILTLRLGVGPLARRKKSYDRTIFEDIAVEIKFNKLYRHIIASLLLAPISLWTFGVTVGWSQVIVLVLVTWGAISVYLVMVRVSRVFMRALGRGTEAALLREEPQWDSGVEGPERDEIDEYGSHDRVDRTGKNVGQGPPHGHFSNQAVYDGHVFVGRSLVRTESRLRDELLSLTTRARYNLVVGVALGMVGLIVPGVSIYIGPNEMWAIVRVAVLTVAVEVIALFFLRLHRTTLSEIRNIHNELTNHEARVVAWNIVCSWKSPLDESVIRELVREFVKTERNPEFPSSSFGGAHVERFSHDDKVGADSVHAMVIAALAKIGLEDLIKGR